MKTKIFSTAIVLGLFSLSLAAQQPAGATLMTIGGEKVAVEEFVNVFKKNNNKDGTPIDRKSMEEYLNLYTIFRLKVKEAKDMGIDTTKTFIDELAGYRKTLSQPYLTEKETIESLVKEAYDRMKWDIRTSHILIKLEADPSPEDTLEAYNRILLIKDFLNNKATPVGLKKCETLIVANHKASKSSDTSEVYRKLQPLKNMMKMKTHEFAYVANTTTEHDSKIIGGDVGYLTGLTGQGFPYEYENAAYNAKVGELVGPVRTSMGYHLIRVTDKRAHKEIRVSHLMLQFKRGMTLLDSTQLKARVDSISKAIKGGADFNELVSNFSDHKQTAKKGGDLGWLAVSSNFPLEFKDAAFEIKTKNSYSYPVQTRFGWHIIKWTDERELPSFDSLKVELKAKILQDGRMSVAKNKMLQKIKTQYQFKELSKSYTEFYSVVDSTLFMGLWNISKAKGLNKPLFKLLDKTFTQEDFARYIDKNYKLISKMPVKRTVDALYKRFVDESSMNFKESRLELEFPEFKLLMDEYRDGILLFNLTDQKVWTKAIKDTTGAKEYHEKFKNHFMWDDRLDASVYTCRDEKTADGIRKMLKKNKSDVDILTAFNKDTAIKVSIESKLFLKGENTMMDVIGWAPGVTQNQPIKGKVVFANIRKIVKSTPKTYMESRGLVTSEYQSWLEKEWVESLRQKYPVTVDSKVFDSIK